MSVCQRGGLDRAFFSGAAMFFVPETASVTAPAATAHDGVWATLREAVRGSSIDYTTAPVGRAVIMLAVPMVMEMAMESIFAVADVFWVAHLGADAVATVGLTESMLTMIYTVAMGLSIGATALVARRIGEQDPEGASRAAVQSILLGVIVAALIARRWRRRTRRTLLRADGRVARGRSQSGSGFTRVMLGGNATVVLLFLINAVFRGAGDAAIAMRVLVARQRHQHRPRAVLHLRARAVSGAGRHRRGGRDQHRARHARCVVSARHARARQRPRAPGRRHLRLDLLADAERAAAVGIRHVPDPDRHGELRRPGAHPVGLRQRRARRLHDRHPRHHLRAAAVVRHQQRRGDDGGAEPGGRASRSRGARGVDGGVLQHALPRRRRRSCSSGRGAADRRALHRRSRGAPYRGRLPAHREPRVPVLRVSAWC